MMLEGYDVQDKKDFCIKLNELLVKGIEEIVYVIISIVSIDYIMGNNNI